MAQIVLERLRRKFGGAILETHSNFGNDTCVVQIERLVEIAEFLRDDRELQFDMPIDCTAVDFFSRRPVRFEVVYHFYSMANGHRVRVKVHVGEENPICPSLTPLWPGLNWHEREVWDLYGIRFTGHPNLKRVSDVRRIRRPSPAQRLPHGRAAAADSHAHDPRRPDAAATLARNAESTVSILDDGAPRLGRVLAMV